MGEEAAFGPIWSGAGLSGSDRDDRVSNLLWIPLEKLWYPMVTDGNKRYWETRLGTL